MRSESLSRTHPNLSLNRRNLLLSNSALAASTLPATAAIAQAQPAQPPAPPAAGRKPNILMKVMEKLTPKN